MAKKSKMSMTDLYYTYVEIGTPKRAGNKINIGIDYSSQRAAISLIFKNFGGPLNLSEQAEVFNANKNYELYGLLNDYITPIPFRNWATSGSVPLKDCGKLAEFLEVKPEILNYEEVSNFKIYVEKWVDIVKNTYCLTEEDKDIILKLKPYPENRGK